MITVSASGTISTLIRQSMYTPAATIVAAWMRADTGVGPSIASGNQTCNGIWADLPIGPQKIKRTAAVRNPANIGSDFSLATAGARSTKTTVPVRPQSM